VRAKTFLLLLFLLPVLNLANMSAEQPPKLLSAKPPVYPLAAKAAGIEGAVMLKAVIGKDGKIHDAQAIGGHKELRQAAIDAVSSWQYQPYTEHGVPVDTPTTVVVNFTMGNKKDKALAKASAQAELTKQSSDALKEAAPAAPPRSQ
jgi:TonB family protein